MVTQAQGPQVLFYGYIEEGYLESNMPNKVKENGPDRLKDVTVTVKSGETVIKTAKCRNTGFYAVLLPEGEVYDIVFTKDKYLSRTFQIDTKGIQFPKDEASVKLVADISLFRKCDSPELMDFAKQPYAKCSFDKKRREMIWDMDYTKKTKEQFASMAESFYSSKR
jgi:hypothetical protein